MKTRSLRHLKFRSGIIHISEKLMSYPLVLTLIIESGRGGGGERERESVGIFCPIVRFSHEEFTLVPERTSGMKNENKDLRIK